MERESTILEDPQHNAQPSQSHMETQPATEAPQNQSAPDFYSLGITDVLKMVTGMLNEIVALNDRLPFNENKLTRFHSREPPGISIKDYLLRIVRFTSLDPAILVVLVHYIDLLSQTYPNFALNSLTVHRFLITAVTIGSKGLCDSFCVNSHYAKVGGLQHMELNLLETEFLTRVGYRIAPGHEIFEQYYTSMFQRHGPKEQQGDTVAPLNTQEARPQQQLQPAGMANPQGQPSPHHKVVGTPTPPPDTPENDSGTEKGKFSRAMKSFFHPIKKRGSEGHISAESKRPKS